MPLKRIASLNEMHASESRAFMQELNRFARTLDLQEYVTYSRMWEYPWLWKQLKVLKGRNLRILDIGSERSAFPWFLATQGFRVMISDVSGRFQDSWRRTARRLEQTRVSLRILDSQDLDLSSASIDIYLSVSVLEHVPDKHRAIAEAARVLRPGGLLLMTFDICEPDMGMTFPEWNGRAMNMRELDELFESDSWFEPGLSGLEWNRQDLSDYYAWHRTTALHHNYATGSAAVRRTQEPWPRKGLWPRARGAARAFLASATWYVRRTASSTRTGIRRALEAVVVSPSANRVIGELLFRLAGRRKTGVQSPSRILVIRLDETEDVVFSTPFFRELRKQNPDAFITLIVNPSMLNLMESCPHFNEILTFDWGDKHPLTKLRLQKRALAMAWKQLWKRRFDIAMVPHHDTDAYHSSFLAYWSGAVKRPGCPETASGRKGAHNSGSDSLYTDLHPIHVPMHEVCSNLGMLGLSPGRPSDSPLELFHTTEDEQAAVQLLQSRGVERDERLVVFGIGAPMGRRRWPLVRFLDVAKWLADEYDTRILLVGGPDDSAAAGELESALKSRIISLAGAATPRQNNCILKRSRLFIGNHSGATSLAAASGIPVVSISCHPAGGVADHGDSPVRTAPWCDRNIVLQPQQPVDPCSGACGASVPHCILQITAADVRDAASRFLEV